VQKLGKLIAVYDDNGISIDGKVVGWFGDNTAERFEAYGWHVQRNVDGQNSAAVAAALAAARAETGRPSLICEDDHRLGSSQQTGHGFHARRSHGQRRDCRHPPPLGVDLATV